MLRIGLTGGIACGKSVVVSMFRDLDCPVLESDPLVHELLEPGQAVYAEVVREFGAGILGPGGAVDRTKLGAIVFAHAPRRQRLNEIIHPRVFAVTEQWFAALNRAGGPEYAIAEAALLVESGYYKQFDRLIVVWCKPEQQMERLLARGLTAEQARQRINAQMPIEEKMQFGDDLIDCSCTIEETDTQVVELASKLKELSAAAKRN